MTKIKKLIFLFILSIIPFLLTSCWDYTEVESFLNVLAIAIDKDIVTNDYILTIEVVDILPSSEFPQLFLVESRGRTIFEALRSFINITGRKNNLAHCECFFIGKSAILDGISPLLDLIQRDVEVRADSFIFLTNTFMAKDLLKYSSDKNELISSQITHYINSNGYNGEYALTRAYDIIDKLETEGIDPIISNILLESTEHENLNTVKGLYVVNINSVSGYINSSETKIFNLLTNNELKNLFSLSTPEGDFIVFELIRSHCTIRPKIIDKNIKMIISCDLDAVIAEIEGNCKNYLEAKERTRIISYAEERCINEINSLIYKLQNDFNSDILGFGKKISQFYPNEWDLLKENWYKEYPKIQCEVNVNITLRGSALTNNIIKSR